MLQRDQIGKRIKDLRTKNKFSQNYVAEYLSISQAAYSLIENAQNGIISDHVVVLSDLYEVTTDYILKGDQMIIRISPSEGFIPYYKVKAHAGYIKNHPGNLKEVEKDWYRIPGYNPTIEHCLFEVEGHSMEPNIFPGDILICQEQKHIQNIIDGSVVLLITKDSILVKRARLSGDPTVLLFENDNPGEPKVLEVKKNQIKDIFMVRGKISNVLIYIPDLIGNKKFKDLEESVEMLKKELYRIQSKLKI